MRALLRHDEHMYACLTLELPRDSDANIEIMRRGVSLTVRAALPKVMNFFFCDDGNISLSVARGRQLPRQGLELPPYSSKDLCIMFSSIKTNCK
jgi:hypothetical protein